MMTDPWNDDDVMSEIDGIFWELEVKPDKILIEQYRNGLFELLKDGDNNEYRIDFIRHINEFPELNSNSHVQQQVVRMAILYDLHQKDWLDRLGQYVNGKLVDEVHWDETPGYHELESDDEALTQFRQQLYKLLS